MILKLSWTGEIELFIDVCDAWNLFVYYNKIFVWNCLNLICSTSSNYIDTADEMRLHVKSYICEDPLAVWMGYGCTIM